jgi:hypothetical protein
MHSFDLLASRSRSQPFIERVMFFKHDSYAQKALDARMLLSDYPQSIDSAEGKGAPYRGKHVSTAIAIRYLKQETRHCRKLQVTPGRTSLVVSMH